MSKIIPANDEQLNEPADTLVPEESRNHRATGARKYDPKKPGGAAMELEGPTEKAPRRSFGLQEPIGETAETTRKSDGRDISGRPS